jgi:hypothetical protein
LFVFFPFLFGYPNVRVINELIKGGLKKDRNGEPEGGGSEWEPIKILFKNSAYEPDFTRAPPQASLAKFT